MSHSHNPTTLNMNLGNILGERASVAQSTRFREQMRGSAVAAAMVSPTSQNKRQLQQQAASRAPPAPANEPIILTHRGGQQHGGTVWQNEDYWQKRNAQKRQQRRQRQGYQQQAQYGGPGYAPRPGTYPADNASVGSVNSARSYVPPLALNTDVSSSAQSGAALRAPPLKRRGQPSPAHRGGTGTAGRDMFAAADDYDALQQAMAQMNQPNYSNSSAAGAVVDSTKKYLHHQRHPYPQKPSTYSTSSNYKGTGRPSDSTSPKMRTASSLRVGANARLAGGGGQRNVGSYNKAEHTNQSYGSGPKPSYYKGGMRVGSRVRNNATTGGQKTSRVF